MLLAKCERADQRPNGSRFCMYPGKGSCQGGIVQWKVVVSVGGRLKMFYMCNRHAEKMTGRATPASPDDRKTASFAHAAELEL